VADLADLQPGSGGLEHGADHVAALVHLGDDGGGGDLLRQGDGAAGPGVGSEAGDRAVGEDDGAADAVWAAV